MKINNIAINGVEQTELVKEQYSDENLVLEHSVLVGQTARGEQKKIKLTLQPNQVVEFVFEDGTTWISNADTIDDIYPESAVATTRSAGDVFQIPTELGLSETERGLAKKILLRVFNVFTKKVVKSQVRKLAQNLENKQLNNQIGLFATGPTLQLSKYTPSETEKPFLLFIHGTASSVEGSFGKMADTNFLKFVEETYGNRILAFQHRTLTESPLENLRDLVKALPRNITLHLVSTSRGGLVGELLSRFCNSYSPNSGFTSTEMGILKKEYPERYFNTVAALISEIKNLLQNKKITVAKFVRVACPADGTTLASKRTDIFLNFLMNLVGTGIGAAANPIFMAFKNLVAAAIDSKNDVEVLPGLEVQSPKSPFIKALNAVPDITNPEQTTVIENSLAVISGNAKPALKLSALLIIASKLFYLGKNDLVVNSESMSLGTRRSGRVQQFFYEGDDINHFKYFENRTTNDAITLALKSAWGEKLPGFTDETLNIAAETERNALLGLDGGRVFNYKVSGTKPIVVLLPGIMGSNLSLNNSVLWINYWKFIAGGLKKLTDKNISATSLVATSYKDLTEFLRDDYDVVTFPFDWRLPLEQAADKLNGKILELLKTGQAIKLIGHSMGGVLIRDFMIKYRNGTWEKLKQLKGFRVVFLGAPLNGSYRIPAVLYGMDAITQKLDKIDKFHSEKELVAMFSGFKGILNLLPISGETGVDFAQPETWKQMHAGIADPDWPRPAAKDLEWFANYQKQIKTGMSESDFEQAVYIAGKDDATPCGFRIDEKSTGKELVFLSTSEGDQSVTWESGIPKKMVENNSVFYVNVSHGSLACDPDMFKGIKEILATGSSNLFSKTRPMVRGSEKVFRSPETRDFDLSLMGIEDTLLARKTKTKLTAGIPPIYVSISLGDLFYAKNPVLAGHFANDGILYAEKSINKALNGILSQQLQMGNYPGDIGSSELFITNQSSFKGAVIVGLGSPDSLTASELTKTVEQGVANYLLRIINSKLVAKTMMDETKKIGISSVIIGCGYGGLSIENSIKAIIQGVYNANQKVATLKLENMRLIEEIEFVEKFKDKAVSSLFSISKIEKEEVNAFKIVMEGKGIKTLLGASERIPTISSEGWWNRVSVRKKLSPESKIECLSFNVSTNSSRTEEQELFSTPELVESIIKDISTNNRWTPENAKTIFELLVPNGFKEQLKKHGNISWILDKNTASYPWELLQDSVLDAKPLCVSAGMIRQLSTTTYRTTIKAVTKNNALVVADPDLKSFAGQLPGALKEGQVVAEMLGAHGMETTKSMNENHTDIIRKLFSNEYKIIHLSGHGVFNHDVSKGSGMVIGNDLYLSTREIKQMGTVPELVFVNCCHLGKTDGVAETFYRERYKLAANIGTQLIENGVKCVVAAGWAVNDDAALEFAKVFYRRMFEGSNFGEAIHDARKVIHEKFGHTNTWGAYQCYGDPFYKFDHLKKSKKSQKKKYLIAQQAEVDLTNLLYEVEIGKLPTGEYINKLDYITEAVDEGEVRTAEITEKEAVVYFELGEYDKACEKFGQLLKVEKASFSFSVAEKYCNARAKRAIIDFNADPERHKNPRYLEEINKVINDLDTLNTLSPTSERWNILASTYKRKATLLTVENDKRKAYKEAARYYQKAYALFSNWYSLTNWLTVESALILAGVHKWDHGTKTMGYTIPSQSEALDLLNTAKIQLTQNTDQMSYWDMLASINIKLCSYLVQFSSTENAEDLENIFREISEIWQMAGSKGKRFAEIEHLEFTIDALSIAENNNTKQLKTILEKLKEELIALI